MISYGASIWGTQEYSCINSVQHRACRFFLGVGKFTPNAAVEGDMGWIPAEVRQWNCVLRLWFRLKTMDINRLNYKVYKWAEAMKTQTKNWYYRFQKHLRTINCSHFLENDYGTKHIITTCEKQYLDIYIGKWKNEVNRENAKRGHGQKNFALIGHLKRTSKQRLMWKSWCLLHGVVHSPSSELELRSLDLKQVDTKI